MRIAVLSPVWFPVPPSGYGGIEWIVSLLADGLVDAGHDVTLFASGDSRTKAELASVYEVAPSEWIGHTFWDLRHTLSCIVRRDEFDVISDHTGLLGLALGCEPLLLELQRCRGFAFGREVRRLRLGCRCRRRLGGPRRRQCELIQVERRELRSHAIGRAAHVVEPVRGGDRKFRGVLEPRIVKSALALHLEHGHERVPVRDGAPSDVSM